MKFFILAFALAFSPIMAGAQAIVQGGAVTPGHAARWVTNGVSGDAGGASGSQTPGSGYLTEIGITNTGTPLGINDSLTSAAGGYHSLTFGANAIGGGLINYQANAGAQALPLKICANGTCQTFPFSSSGGIVGPNITTVGNIPIYGNTTGTLLGISSITDFGTFVGIKEPTETGNSFPYGYGSTAVATCTTINPAFANACPVLGSLPVDPTSAAWYPIGDTVGAVIATSGSLPWMLNVPGTFSGNNFIPTTPLTSGQVAKLRTFEVLDTNDSPRCSGIISSWATNGTSVTVEGWFQQGHAPGSTPPCTPVGTQVTNRFSKIYGFNTNTIRTATDQQSNSVGYELDVSNKSGVNDTCYAYDVGGCGGSPQSGGGAPIPSDGGLDVAGTGTDIASFGIQIRGPTAFVADMAITAPATYGIIIQPAGSIGEGVRVEGAATNFSSITGGEAFRSWTGAGPNGGINFQILGNGNMNLGLQNNAGVGANYTQQFFSSGHVTPDAEWTYSGGTGSLDGAVLFNVGLFSGIGTLAVNTGLVNGVLAGFVPPINGGEILMHKMLGSAVAPTAGYGKLAFVTGTTPGTCKLIAFAGTSTTSTTIVDNIGAGC